MTRKKSEVHTPRMSPSAIGKAGRAASPWNRKPNCFGPQAEKKFRKHEPKKEPEK